MKHRLHGAVLGFRRGILNGSESYDKCFVICAPLHGYLSALGEDVELVEGVVDCGEYDLQHFWLRLSDGTIIDPTADQLPRRRGKRPPKVYIGEMPPWYHFNVHLTPQD